MLYKESASIGKDEIIYIRQGEIVRYFEEHKLRDLAKESGKSTEYDEASKKFIEHKQSLEESLEKLIDSYDDCINVIGEGHVLHNSTIENLLNKNFVFTLNKAQITKDVDKSNEILEAAKLLETTLDSAEKLKSKQILQFKEEELNTIDTYISLIKAKTTFLKRKKIAYETKLIFLEQIDNLIDTKNEALNEGARSKSEANKVRESLVNSISYKFGLLVSLRAKSKSFASFDYKMQQSIQVNENVDLILEVEEENSLSNLFLDGIKGGDESKSIYLNTLELLRGVKSIKHFSNSDAESLRKKTRKQLEEVFFHYDNPKDYLKYENGENSKKNSPGYNSEKYLEIILKNAQSKIIFIDQPEDNLGNSFITETLIKLIRDIKFNKQIFLVTHNPSIVVYGDAESVIIAENDQNKIRYKQVVLEHPESQKKVCGILDGGEYIFNMRARKYNIKRILKSQSNG